VRRIAVCLLAAGLASGFRGSTSAAPQSTDEELMRRARQASNDAIRAHDAEAVASFFTDDYSLVSSANLQVAGKEENRANLARQFKERPDVVYVRTPRELGFYAPWGMAYEIGTWEGSWSAGGGVRIGGTYLAKWQKVEGKWLIRAEVFVPTHCEGSAYCDTPP
jgi:ketosteroid isomerase-like protein